MADVNRMFNVRFIHSQDNKETEKRIKNNPVIHSLPALFPDRPQLKFNRLMVKISFTNTVGNVTKFQTRSQAVGHQKKINP